MKQQTPFFITITSEVLRDKSLNPIEKLIFTEIMALTYSCGYCYASNSHFAEIFSRTPETISRNISNLQAKGYIYAEVNVSNGNSRKIYVKYTGQPFPQKHQNPLDENVNTSCQKHQNPLDENVKHSNTVSKSISKSIIKDTNTASGFSNKKEIPVIKESLTTQSVEVEVVEKAKRFQKPTVAEILEYANNLCKKENIKLANLTIEMQNLFDFYEQKDWKVGNTKMKEWKLAVNRWVRGNAVKEQAKQPKTEAQKLLINTENRKAVVDTEAVKKQEEVLMEYAKVKTEKPEFMENFKKVLKNYFGGSFASTIDNLKIKSINQNEIVFMLPNQFYADIMQRNKQKFEETCKREIGGFYKKAFTGSVKLVAWKN